MKALIAKELREGLKWAALILAATGFATAIAMQVPASYWLVGCACATSVPAAAGGLLLGIMSVVFEARADRWAFLAYLGDRGEKTLLAGAPGDQLTAEVTA